MKIIRYFIYLTILTFSASCFTVKYSTSGASIPPDAKTFSVDFFTNKAPLAPPNLALKITTALKQKFTDNTRLNLVGRNGDLMFEGEIVSYDMKPVNIQSNDQAGNMRLTVQVKVTFVNMKAHEWDFSTPFSQYVDLGAEQLEPTDSQIEELNNKIIDEIFNKSVANW
jgi:hypothetical protein